MTLDVLYFAWLRERIGAPRERVETSAATVRDLGIRISLVTRVFGAAMMAVPALATALGEQGLAQYEAVHGSSGLLAPLFVGLAWLLFVAVNTQSRARRWLRSAVVLGFAAVSLAGNAAIDAALADPGDGAAVTTASVLVIARWVLLVLLLAVTGAVAVEALRRRSRTAGAPRQDPRSGQRG